MSRSSLPCLAKYRLRYLGGKLNTTHPPTELCLTMVFGTSAGSTDLFHLRATLSHISLLQCVMVFFCIFSCFQKFNTELKGLKKKKSPIVSTSGLYLKKKRVEENYPGDHKPSILLSHPVSFTSLQTWPHRYLLPGLAMPLHALWRPLPMLVMVRAGHQGSAAARGYSAITWNMGI